MRALIRAYGPETIWAVVLLLVFLSTPARAQPDFEFHFEPNIGDCPPPGIDCARPGGYA